MEPLKVARGYFEAWNRRDPAAIVATFASGGTVIRSSRKD